MAYLNTTASPLLGFGNRLRAGIEALRTRRAQYRLYRETLNGLGALSNRDLADLGLTRSELPRVAYEAAYK